MSGLIDILGPPEDQRSGLLGEDVDYFMLPPLVAGDPAPVHVGILRATSLTDRPEVRALMNFIASPSWGEVWAGVDSIGETFFSSNRRFDTAAYTGQRSQPNIDVRLRIHEDHMRALEDGSWRALDVVAHSIATDWIDRPALARQAELKQASETEAEIVQQRNKRLSFDTTRQVVDGWVGRPTDPSNVPPPAPPFRPTNEWSELNDTDLVLAKWAGRGPADYIPEEGGDPNRPTKSWDEMEDTERYRAEIFGYEPVGDRWQQAPEPPERLTRRKLPTVQPPGR